MPLRCRIHGEKFHRLLAANISHLTLWPHFLVLNKVYYIMYMRLPFKNIQHITLFSVYAPTLVAYPAVKSSFHSELRRHLNNTPVNDKKSWYLVTSMLDLWGTQWPGRESLEGTALVTAMTMGASCLCSALSANLPLRTQCSIGKITLRQSGCIHGPSIGIFYVLVRRQDLKDVLYTRVVLIAALSCPLQAQAAIYAQAQEEWSFRKEAQCQCASRTWE